MSKYFDYLDKYKVSYIEKYFMNLFEGDSDILRLWNFSFLNQFFKKSSIFWPQQPPTEIVSDISKNLDFSWLIPQKGASISYFGARDDQIIKSRKFFE